MIPVTMIDRQAKEVYEQVFVHHTNQGNEGRVALCCGVFFSRTKTPKYSEHTEVVTLAEFKRRTGVRTQAEFLLWARNATPKFGPRINAQACDLWIQKQKVADLTQKLLTAKTQLEKLALPNKPFKVSFVDSGASWSDRPMLLLWRWNATTNLQAQLGLITN